MPTKERCRAKVRSRCRKHGPQERMAIAIRKSDWTAYQLAASELEALKKSNWDESEWGFIRPESRPVEGVDDINTLLASEEILADSYSATFELPDEYFGRIRRHAKKKEILAGTGFAEDGSHRVELVAHNKQELYAIKDIFDYLNQKVEENNLQGAGRSV